MAIALVQSRKSVVTGVDSQGLTFSSAVTAGNLIIVYASTYSGDLGTTAASDNKSNTYTRRGYVALNGQNTFVAVYSAIASTGGSSFTITINPTGSSADLTFIIAEFSGVNSTPFDKAVNADSSSDSTSATTGNLTPAENNELWVGAVTHNGTDRTLTETNGTRIDENEGGSSNMPLSATYKVQTTATAEAATWTIGTGNVHWGCTIAAFKAAGGTTTSMTLTGGMTPSGTIAGKTGKTLTGGMTPAGTVARVMGYIRSLAGGATPSGTVTRKTGKTLTGGATPAGSVTRRTGKSLTGGITPSGTVSRVMGFVRSLAGGVTSAGVVVKSIAKSLAGSIASAGAYVGGKVTAGFTEMTFAGGVALAGTVSWVLSLVRSFSGGIASAGVLIKKLSTSFSGGIQPGGVLSSIKAKIAAFAGGLTPSGTISRVMGFARSLSGGITPTGTLARVLSIVRTFTGSITSGGVITRIMAFIRSFAGGLTPSGGVAGVKTTPATGPGARQIIRAALRSVFNSGGRSSISSGKRDEIDAASRPTIKADKRD